MDSLLIVVKRYIFRILKSKYTFSNRTKLKCKNDKIILVGTPEHGNIGDLCIAYAEIEFLKKSFPQKTIVDIPDSETEWFIGNKKKYIKSTDMLVLHGGGNMGGEYPHLENTRRKIIEEFPHNPKIIFPQTFYYSSNDMYLKESKDYYKKSASLKICAREIYSFDNLKKQYEGAQVFLVPDIVFSLPSDFCCNDYKRKGILCCLRNDSESVISNDLRKNIVDIAKKYSGQVEITDMHYGKSVLPQNRLKVIKQKLEQFSKAELVITDRIHGMIFCAISSTPCIALNNYNYKVKGSYKWIQSLEYIKFHDSMDDIEESISKLLFLKYSKYDNKYLQEYYDELTYQMKNWE